LFYDDNWGGPLIEGPKYEDEELKNEDKDYLYQNNVVKMVEQYYDDKYTDLEKKRATCERAIEELQADQF
jgi:hypothetical protein